MNIVTKNITGAEYLLDIDKGVFRLSFQAQGGNAAYRGVDMNGYVSEDVTLLEGDSVVLSADPNSAIKIYLIPTSAIVLLIFYS